MILALANSDRDKQVVKERVWQLERWKESLWLLAVAVITDKPRSLTWLIVLPVLTDKVMSKMLLVLDLVHILWSIERWGSFCMQKTVIRKERICIDNKLTCVTESNLCMMQLFNLLPSSTFTIQVSLLFYFLEDLRAKFEQSTKTSSLKEDILQYLCVYSVTEFQNFKF